MDVFQLRGHIILEAYASYASSFIDIADVRIRKEMDDKFALGLLWPEPLLQLNPSFAPDGSIDQLVAAGRLHPDCARIFRLGTSATNPLAGWLEQTAGVEMRDNRKEEEIIAYYINQRKNIPKYNITTRNHYKFY